MKDAALQEEYFDQVAYRDPMHPVVGAHADPKVEFIKQYARGVIADTEEVRFVRSGGGKYLIVIAETLR